MGIGGLALAASAGFSAQARTQVSDPLLVHGLQITEQAITHIANGEADPEEPNELGFS